MVPAIERKLAASYRIPRPSPPRGGAGELALGEDGAQDPPFRVLAEGPLAHQDEKGLLDDLLRLPRGDAVLGEDLLEQRAEPLQELCPGFLVIHRNSLGVVAHVVVAFRLPPFHRKLRWPRPLRLSNLFRLFAEPTKGALQER